MMVKRTQSLILYKAVFSNYYSVEQPFSNGKTFVVFKGNKKDCDDFMMANPKGFAMQECIIREKALYPDL